MIRLAVCDTHAKARSALRQALGTLAAQEGVSPIAIGQFTSISEAFQRLQGMRGGFCTLLLCNIDYTTEQDDAALMLMKRTLPNTRIVLTSVSPAAAMTAYRAHVDDFILLSDGANEFTRVMKEQIRDITIQRGPTITLKSREGIEVLDANSIFFAETSSSGPLIHLKGGKEVQVRGTLQALYEQMAHDTRFVKAGSSFIVNLDNVQSAGKNSLVFPDGSIIIIPIRARKPLQEALEAYRAGES